MPCYIQPADVDKLNSLLQKRRRPIKNPNSIDITETDDETDDDSDGDASRSATETTPKTKPYRCFIFDIECAQEDEVQTGRFKHEALIVCAELIYTECSNRESKLAPKTTQNVPLRAFVKEQTLSTAAFVVGLFLIPMVGSFNSTISMMPESTLLTRCLTSFAIMAQKILPLWPYHITVLFIKIRINKFIMGSL